MDELRHFAEELETLTQRLLFMGGLAEERVRGATLGLMTRDAGMLAQIVSDDEPINRLQLEIDERALKLLALHQPMAVDLRSVVAAMKINGDLERVGDLAVNIAQAAERYLAHPPVTISLDLGPMADLAQQMLRQALDAFVGQEIHTAERVLIEDDRLDHLKDRMFRELLTFTLTSPGTIESVIELILITRHLERIGDHATNIAEDVIFIVDARDVRHHPPPRV